jgi:Spy/CpxP family protein refolding chaperone
MDTISKSKWQVRGAAIVIFLLGFAAGALSLNAYKRWERRGGPPSREELFDRMANNLKLNADQKSQVQKIFGETREQLQALRKESEPRVGEIRKQADERLQKVLTPEQWTQFQQMRTEMRSRGRRGRENSSSTP